MPSRYILTGANAGKTTQIGRFMFTKGVCEFDEETDTPENHRAMRNIVCRFHGAVLEGYSPPKNAADAATQRLEQMRKMTLGEARAFAVQYDPGAKNMKKDELVALVMRHEFVGWQGEQAKDPATVGNTGDGGEQDDGKDGDTGDGEK